MLDYTLDDFTPDQARAEEQLYRPLTDAVRDLIDATLRTEVDPDEIAAVTAEVEGLTRRLRARQLPGSYGVRVSSHGVVRNHGNAVIGMRNAIAPPLRMQSSPDGRAWVDFRLGAAYEGPPGLVHGGVSAMILDQVCGEAAAAAGTPGMTGTLSMRYLKGTALGELRAEAEVTHSEGVKTYVAGRVLDADGQVTVEAEGLFILPRWARELGSEAIFE